MPEEFRNLARSTLASGITSTATQLSVATGDGNSLFPELSGSNFFRCVLFQKTAVAGQGNIEFIKVIGRTGDIFTIERNQEGVGNLFSQAYAFNAGDLIELRPTRGFFESISNVTTSLIQSSSYNYAVDTGAVNQLTIALSPALTSYSIPGRYMVLAGNTNTGDTTLSINGLPPQEIFRTDGDQLAPGDIVQGKVSDVVYDGLNFVLLNRRTPIIPANVALRDAPNTFAGVNTFSDDNTFNGENAFNGVNTFNGNVALGATAADTIQFNGDTAGNITPNADNTDNLGTEAKQFKDLYINGVGNIDELILSSGSVVSVIHDEDDMVSNDNAGLATQQSVRNFALNSGVGGRVQSWNDVSGSRAVGNIYRNTTNAPIMVSAIYVLSASAILEALVGSSSPPNRVVSRYSSSFGDLMCTFSFIVPDRDYYKINLDDFGTSGVTEIEWLELS